MNKIITILLIFISYLAFGQGATPNLRAIYSFYRLESASTSAGAIKDEKDNNNGTNIGGTSATGKVGDCLYFTDETDYVDVGTYSDLFDDVNTEISVCVWVKLSTISVNQFIIGKYSNNPVNRAFYMSTTTTGAARIFIGDNTSSYVFYTTNSSPISTGSWYHIAVANNTSSQTTTFWVDGVEYANTKTTSGTPTSVLFSNSIPMRIARIEQSGAVFTGITTGNIDEVKIFPRVIKEIEAKQDYNSGNGLLYVQENFKKDKNYENLINYVLGRSYFAWITGASY